MSIIVFFEGGGNRNIQRKEARRGLRLFLDKADLVGKMPRIMACGGRDNAFRDFRNSHKTTTTTALLLVDSEGPVSADSPWLHLKVRDGWERPPLAADNQCHLMVQLMESWFLADREALAEYYGPGFRSHTIPQWSNIERVPKSDVLDKLGRATRGTGKGSYQKGRDSFKILGTLDPNKVTNASSHAKGFVASLKKLGSSL